MRTEIRRGTPDDVPLLKASLSPTDEQVPFHQAVTFIAETDGIPTHFAAARLVWIVEPLKEIAGAPKIPHNARRRSVRGLAAAVEEFIGDRVENRTGVHSYFAHVLSNAFQILVQHWGMREWYPKCRLFVKDL